MSETEDQIRVSKIAMLNDEFRRTFEGGKVVVTRAVSELLPVKQLLIFSEIRNFSDFKKRNDPHHEHDFGEIKVAGDRYWFKIDYYDQNLEYGSEDPADPEKTTRVMTIMTPEDY